MNNNIERAERKREELLKTLHEVDREEAEEIAAQFSSMESIIFSPIPHK